MEIITSKDNTRIKNAKKLYKKKNRISSYLIEGQHLYEEALKSGANVKQIFVTEKFADIPDAILVSDEVMIVDTHFQVSFQGQTVPMAGIGYVASYPEFRGNGAASQLMTEILQENYQKETLFSYLAPFSYSFYSKFGYRYVFNQKHYEIDAADFPLGEKTHLTVKRTDFVTAQQDLASVHV